MLTLSQLLIYPVKSFAGQSLSQSELDDFGLLHDRRWMVVDATTGAFLSQRVLPQMCGLSAEPRADGLYLTDRAGDRLFVPTPDGGQLRQVSVWEYQGAVWDAGNLAAEWLHVKLGQPCRLVYFPAQAIRLVDPAYATAHDKTAFSDGFPLLLISQASLNDLNQRLSAPVTMSRFRPNLVVEGGLPFAEDDWSLIQIGDAILKIVKPCSRCNIPNIDPATAQTNAEVMQVLAGYRKRNHKVYFGQNVTIVKAAPLQQGMTVTILE